MNRKAGLVLIPVAALIGYLVLKGKGEEPPPGPCTKDSECPSGYRCSNGTCIPIIAPPPGGYVLTLDIEPAEYSSLNKVWIEPKSNGYLYGTRVTLTAEPNPAFFFDHWEITGQNEQPTNSTIQILMTNNVRVTAVFRPTWMPSPNEWYLTLNWDIILGRIYVNGDRVWLPGYWTLYHQGDSLAIYAETFFNRTFGGYRMAVDGGPESPVGVPGYQTLILGDRETKGHQRVYIWADM